MVGRQYNMGQHLFGLALEENISIFGERGPAMKNKSLKTPEDRAKIIDDVFKLVDPNDSFVEFEPEDQLILLLADIQHWADVNAVHYVRAEDKAREIYANRVIAARKQANDERK